MIRKTSLAAMLALMCISAADAQQQGVTRKVLLQSDLQLPNQQLTFVAVEIPAGGREGKHTHPGGIMVYVQEGDITLDYEGSPTRTYHAGETFFIEAGKVHEGINNGSVPAKALAGLVAEKGVPLATQAQ